MHHRRTILKGVASLPFAAILAVPLLAHAAAVNLEQVSLVTAEGRAVAASLALPEAAQAPAILLVHEWWGLNDQIKAVAAEFAREGFVALAVDLYDGGVAKDPGGARALMQKVDAAEATDTLTAWIAWLRRQNRANGKLATIGWCFGGGWSLNASLAPPADATVVYYGSVAKTADQLASLNGPVLGHFATKDQWINEDMVGGFEGAMAAAGKSFETHWYEAEHAFANPSGARYDETDTTLAWQRTLAFLKHHL